MSEQQPRLTPEQQERALARFDADARDIEFVKGKGLMPRNAAGFWWLTKVYEKSGMLPAGLETKERAFMALQFGTDLGLSPTECLRSVMVVNNRPALYGDAPLGLIRASGLLEWIEESIEGDGDDMVAVCRAKRKDQEQVFEERFGVADAQAAGLLRSAMYAKYRRRMLKYRARGYCLRDAFPDVLMGAYTVEELDGMDAPAPRAERVTPERAMGGDELTEALRAKAEIQEGSDETEPGAVRHEAGEEDAEGPTPGDHAAVEAEAQVEPEVETPAEDPPRGGAGTDRPPTDAELENQLPFDPDEV